MIYTMCQRQFSLLAVIAVLFMLLEKEVSGQFFYGGGPRRGSVSRVNNNVYERDVDLGPIDLSRGVANSRVVNRNGGGFRNGGTTSIENRNALSRGVNIAGLPIGSTLTRSQTFNNGAVSRGVGYDFNVGNLGLGASLDPNNLQNGFGLRRQPDGNVNLGLGLLNLGLTNNAQARNPYTQAQVDAEGRNARARANSNSRVRNSQFGGVGVQEKFLNSNAVGRARYGTTRGRLNGIVKRSVADAETLVRQKREPNPRRRKPSNQQAGANTHSNNQYNPNGFFQDNGASSIGSNLAQDGSSGQVSSANTNQMQSYTAGGFQSNNDAQSQSLNFNQFQNQATNTNTGTRHTFNANGERVGANGGAQATNMNQFGTGSNIANTNANYYREGDFEGSNADSSGQSIFQGADGQFASSLTNSKVETKRGPNGFVSKSASSSASSMSANGGNANADASAAA